MARPTKPMALQSRKLDKEEIEKRIELEKQFRGGTDQLKPPRNITKGAKRYFKSIVDFLSVNDIVGNGDVHIIKLTAMTLDKIDTLEKTIQLCENIEDLNTLYRLQDTIEKKLPRYFNELGLSPSSRAKIINSLREEVEESTDPLLQLLEKRGN